MARDGSDKDQHRLGAESVSVVEDGETHVSDSRCCCAQRGQPSLVLASGLPDRGAYDDLIDLVLAQACSLERVDVSLGDRPGAVRDLLCKRAQGLSESFIGESCAPDLRRRTPLPFEDSRNQGTVQRSDVRQGSSGFQLSLACPSKHAP